MTYVVSFDDFMPEPRFDGQPWVLVTLDESPDDSGPWTEIDRFDLSLMPGGIDADPEHPAARRFTTQRATLPEGWYRITFRDAGGGEGPVVPVQRSDVGEQDFLPTVTDVARELLSRTRDKYGTLAGTFNADTMPTDTDVLAIVYSVAPMVADAVGDDIPVALQDDAKKVIALRAAMQIETSFFSDQVNTGRSIYPQLEKQYEVELNRLQRQAILLEESGSLLPTDSGPTLSPKFKFPKSTDDLLTRRM